MNIIKRFEIPAKHLSPSLGLASYLFILGLGVFAYFLYVSFSLFSAKNFIPAAIILLVGLGVSYLMCIRPLKKRKNARPLIIEIFENELGVSLAQKNIPLAFIEAKLGDLKLQHSNDGWLTEYKIGDALVLKIDNFEAFFKLSFGDTFSPLFNEPQCFKIPIGERGLSKDDGMLLLKSITRVRDL